MPSMHRLLMASPNRDALSVLASTLEKHNDVDLFWVESGGKALAAVSDTAFDLVVIDERLGDMTGLELADKLISVNPMINCAVISALSPDDFHEASEGLGIMEQLPIQPGKKQTEELLQRLKNLKDLMSGVNVRRT